MLEKLKRALHSIVEKVSTEEVSDKTIEKYRDEIVFTLLECDVALPVAEYIVEKMKENAKGVRIKRFSDKKEVVQEILRNTIIALFEEAGSLDLVSLIDKKRKEKKEPFVILFVGPNGHGKTTTIAKLAYMLKSKGFTVVLSASDTFRAGAIEQLEIHARKLSVPIIKQRYGADPAAVAYDAVQFARKRKIDVVLIDTAGRLQTDVNLMEEMRKIARVVKPDLVIFVGDALTGSDALDEAEKFYNAVGFDAFILTKMDADAKGGAALSITYATKKPLIYIGTGQNYEDLQPFDPKEFVKMLGLM